MTRPARAIALLLLLLLAPRAVRGQQPVGPAVPPRVPRPLRQDSVTIRAVNVDLRAAVQLLGQYLDRPVLFSGPGTMPVALETPQPVPRGDVVRLLRGLLESHGYELVDDTTARMYQARPREAARVAPPTAGDQLARAAGSGGVELFVIRLRHARASDVASTVNALYGRGSGMDGSGRRATLADELRANQVPPVGGPVAVPGVTGGAARSSTFTGDVTIVPDTRANSLLIRANRADFALIEAAVNQIDVRPLQVIIEALIAEVRRDRSLDVGVEISVPDSHVRGTEDMTVGGSVGGSGDRTGGAGLGEMVLKVMGIGGINADVVLRAAAGHGDVSIMSRPVVVAANNEEAQIVIGSQRPFVQVQRALPTENAVRDQIVQYKDVGIKLSVRPTISADGTVQLEVSQEVSNATGETSFNAPVISTRSVQTQLLVHDGQTVMLGGLTDGQRDATRSGIPFLSEIPVIGFLFGRHTRRYTETELYVFLTPRVIRSDDDAARISAPLRERAERAKP